MYFCAGNMANHTLSASGTANILQAQTGDEHMYTIHKLKPDRSVNGLIPAIAALSGGVILGIFWSIQAGFTFIALFFWAYLWARCC